MGQDSRPSDVLNDPLWAAAVPLAEAAALHIGADLVARRETLVAWRRLEAAVPRGTLAREDIEQARVSEALVPYPYARAALTRLLKDGVSADEEAVKRSLAKQGASITTDVAAREAAFRLWTRLHSAMREGRLQIALRILQDQRLAATPRLYPELAQRHNRVSISVRRALDRGLTVLRDAILHHAQERGWQIAATERRIVIDQLINVELAEDRTTRVQATRVRSLSWDAVRPVLDSEYDRVWGRARRDASFFISELERFLASRPADNVRLREVYDELKLGRPAVPGRLATYYRDEFSADLSVLVTSDLVRRFEFSAIRDPRLAFPVVQPDGSLAQYGFVRKRAA